MNIIKPRTFILDYGTTNVTPLARVLNDSGFHVVVKPISELESIDPLDVLILPGIGKWDYSMEELTRKDISECISYRAESGGRILGICLGMQLMSIKSSEGKRPGLGIVQCAVKEISLIDERSPRVNNGWHQICEVEGFGMQSQLSKEIDFKSSKYYFSHSFGYSAHELAVRHPEFAIFVPVDRKFVAAFLGDNLAGIQFHPERSHVHGVTFLQHILEKWSK